MRWAMILVALILASPAAAGVIRPFQFSVPSLWSPDCALDSSNAVPDWRPVTALVRARGGWWMRARTYYDVPRDSVVHVVGMEGPGGFCLVDVRVSVGVAMCGWSKPLSNVSVGY